MEQIYPDREPNKCRFCVLGFPHTVADHDMMVTDNEIIWGELEDTVEIKI
jgi:hypothetical protein